MLSISASLCEACNVSFLCTFTIKIFCANVGCARASPVLLRNYKYLAGLPEFGSCEVRVCELVVVRVILRRVCNSAQGSGQSIGAAHRALPKFSRGLRKVTLPKISKSLGKDAGLILWIA